MIAESLFAARSALDGGAAEVALSAGGCQRYQRKVVNGFPADETISLNGKAALNWEYTPTQSVGQRDTDLDGFPEWQATIKRGAVL